MTQSPINKGIFFHYGSHWKRIRSILTPTFSTGKLKAVRYLLTQNDLSNAFINMYINFFLLCTKCGMHKFTYSIQCIKAVENA